MLGRTLDAAPFGVVMAKSFRHLYERIYDFENLHQAYLRARKGKRHKPEVLSFERDLEGSLIQLQNELIWGQYKTGAYRSFTVHEPKERQISALPFRDRVVQHALCGVIEPIWETRFIADSYACRDGRGTHRGADRAEFFMRKVKRQHGCVFALKADIAKYFYSIDHTVLKAQLGRYIKCRRTFALISGIIDSSARPGDVRPSGIPIGNLTSQLCANVYLHALDEFMKDELREKFYVRYMDDFVVIHHDKAHLHEIRRQAEEFLMNRLRLRTNAKTQVFPVSSISGRALDFLGYRIWTTHRKIRKSSVRRIVSTLKRLKRAFVSGSIPLSRVGDSIRSWLAHCRHANSATVVRQILGAAVFSRSK